MITKEIRQKINSYPNISQLDYKHMIEKLEVMKKRDARKSTDDQKNSKQ